MGKAFRHIDPNIRQSESVAELSFRQRDLWTRLILSVDDQGRCSANPALVRSMVWPLEDITLAEVTEDLQALSDKGFILIYEAEGKRCIQIINWHEYQAQAEWLGQSELPCPLGWEDRYRYHGKGNEIIKSKNWTTITKGSKLPSRLPSPLPANDGECDGDGDGDGKGEDESDSDNALDQSISPIQLMIEKVTGLPPSGIQDVKAMDEIQALQPIQEDIQAAYKWYISQGKKFRYYSSLVGPVRTAIAERIQSANTIPKPKRNKQTPWEYDESQLV